METIREPLRGGSANQAERPVELLPLKGPQDPVGTRACGPPVRAESPSPHPVPLTGSSLGQANSAGGQGSGPCHLLFHLPDLLQASCLLLLQLLLVLLQVLCHLGGRERQGISTAQTGNLASNPATVPVNQL